MVGVGSPPSAIVLVPNHMHAHCVRILFIGRVARGCVVAEEFWPPSTGGAHYRRDHGTTQPIRGKKTDPIQASKCRVGYGPNYLTRNKKNPIHLENYT